MDMGPVATFNLGTKTKASDEVKRYIGDGFESTKSATFGYQFGVGLDILKKVTIDVRYEFGLSKLGDKVSVNGQEFKTDQRMNQFIGSIGFFF
jgi:opacity protein-like surface antigen